MRPLCLWLLFFERSSLASRVCACVCRIPLSTLGRGQRFIAFFLSVSIPFFLIRFFLSLFFFYLALLVRFYFIFSSFRRVVLVIYLLWRAIIFHVRCVFVFVVFFLLHAPRVCR